MFCILNNLTERELSKKNIDKRYFLFESDNINECKIKSFLEQTKMEEVITNVLYNR